MKEKKLWAILDDSDSLLGYEEASSEAKAIKAFAKKANVEDVKWLHAVPGDKVRDDVEIPGWLLSALEYGPDFAFGPWESARREWDEFWKAVKALEARDIRLTDVVGWVRVHSALDLWSPIVR